ncbi:MAG: PH domain-containing protein [Bacteroidota bacterium]
MDAEKTIYQTSPSQVRNLQPFFFAGLVTGGIIAAAALVPNSLLLIALVLPFGYMFWKWLEIKCTKLTVTDQRIIVSEGVLNKTTNETELYRVRDTTVEEPWYYRIFSLGRIIVFTTDEAKATHSFEGYAKPHWIKDQIRNNAEICRQKKRWGIDNILMNEHSSQ